MNFPAIAAELSQAVLACESLLRQVRNADATFRPAPDKWSKKEILGHLIDSAANNHQRFVRAAAQGSLDFPGYDQEKMVAMQSPNVASWELLVELWSAYNRYLAYIVGQLPASCEQAQCVIAGRPPVTLLWMANDYVEHMKHHLNQIVGNRFPTAYGAKA
jgi:DinB family protein